MSNKQVTVHIQEALKAAKKNWEEYQEKNKLPPLRVHNRNIFSELAEATAEPLISMLGEDGKAQLLYPQEAVIVLLGAAEYLQARYVDRLRR
jgi:hypothetical protein